MAIWGSEGQEYTEMAAYGYTTEEHYKAVTHPIIKEKISPK
jgi:hypothetical protein